MSDTRNLKKTVLIVDNSFLIIDRLIGMLKEAASVEIIFTATNFNEAVDILKINKTDIVLLDIQLPGENGIELLKYIMKTYSGIKVVMLSNQVSKYYQQLCKKEGAVNFIDKSKDFDLIPEIVAAL